MSSTLILGIGNVLMGDEGIGVYALEALTHDNWPAHVTLVDGGTGGFHLLSYLRDYDPVIMIDATMDGQAPGTVSLILPRYATDFPRSLTAHDIGLRDLVEATALVGSLPTIHLITVSIDRIQSMVLSLSDDVASAIPRIRAVARGLTARETASVYA